MSRIKVFKIFIKTKSNKAYFWILKSKISNETIMKKRCKSKVRNFILILKTLNYNHVSIS